MNRYICKCGRVVAKSTKADNTGNRDTAGCEGCPYLLPWGPMVWDDRQKRYTQDVQGYECRMSPEISYATDYSGSEDDKCTLKIHSLDLTFLDEVQAWIDECADGQLSGRFSRDSIRGTDYCNKGRYSWSISCAQNRKGMAAKAALIEHFFGPDKHRLDMTMQQEKAHILAAIEAGKARAQKKEDKALTYKDPATGWLYRVGPEPFQGCYLVYYMDPKSSAFWKRCPQNSLHAGNKTAEGEEEYLRLNAKRNGWVPVEDAPGENPTPAAEDVQPCAPIASDAPPFQSPSANADVQQGGEDDAANPTDAAPTSPADAGTATQSLSAADPASLEAESAQLAFDYSGLDDQTVADLHLAEREYAGGKKMAEMGLRRMAEAVAIAHDALCVTDATICRTGGKFASPEQSFSSWCESMGLNRKAAERLLQVSRLMNNSSPREQKVLEELTPSVLYEASRPSAEPEAVEALKQQQVKTLKEYRELEARLKAEREAKEKAQQDAAQASKREEEARAAAHQYHVKYQEANDQRNRLLDEQGVYISRITEAEEKVKAAQAEVARQKRIGMEMQEEVESRDERIRELEQSQTVVAGTADPEEIERRAQEIAKTQIAENDAKWAEITENQGRKLRELLANSGASQVVKTAAASVQTILDELFQALSLEEDDVAGQAALEDLEDLLFDWSDSIHNMLHPEDTLGYPPDDEEGDTDDET